MTMQLAGLHLARDPSSQIRSFICDETGKAFVHVILMMAVEEGCARIVRQHIDLRRGIARQADGILHQPGHQGVAHLRR